MWNPLNTQVIRGDCHPELPRSHQFHRSATYGGGSMSLEEAQVLCSLVQIIKPEHALETGCESGFSAAYMALGCSLNGFGKVHTIELNPEWAVKARENLVRDGVSDWVEVVIQDSLSYINETPLSFGFALLDTHISFRSTELEALRHKMLPGGIVAVHDSSPLHPMKGNCNLLEELRDFGMQLIHLPSPRGLTILQIQ